MVWGRTEHRTFTEPRVSTIDSDLSGLDLSENFDTCDVGDGTHLHNTLCLLRVCATFANDNVTAMGRPSGMKATKLVCDI